MIPMDLMSLQPEINLDHVKEAGLDPNKPPMDSDSLLEWAKAMTKREGDKVTRSGIMMTGSGVQPTVTWGIVAEQMGFQRASDDLKTACVNPDAGKAAMQWVLDLFDKHKVSTRDVTDRYKAFGTGQGSIFWTGPWTLNGYVQQKLQLQDGAVPQDRRQASSPTSRWAAWNSTNRPIRPPRSHHGGRQMAVGQQLPVDDRRSRRFAAQIHPRASGLQDRRQPMGHPWRLRRRHELCHGRRDPRA